MVKKKSIFKFTGMENKKNNLIKTILFLTITLMIPLLACQEKEHVKSTKREEIFTEIEDKFTTIPEVLNLESSNSEGVFTIKKQSLKPDYSGILADIALALPAYEKGIYYRPFSSKLASGNRMEALWFNTPSELEKYTLEKPRLDDDMDLGAFLVLKKTSGIYLAILPLVSKEVGNTLFIENNTIKLKTATYGTSVVDADAPLIAYAESSSIYEAAYKAWSLAKASPNLAG